MAEAEFAKWIWAHEAKLPPKLHLIHCWCWRKDFFLMERSLHINAPGLRYITSSKLQEKNDDKHNKSAKHRIRQHISVLFCTEPVCNRYDTIFTSPVSPALCSLSGCGGANLTLSVTWEQRILMIVSKFSSTFMPLQNEYTGNAGNGPQYVKSFPGNDREVGSCSGTAQHRGPHKHKSLISEWTDIWCYFRQ